MKALIAVELRERDGKPTCEGCEIGSVESEDTRVWCIRQRDLMPGNRPNATCPLRTSQADRLVREAIAILETCIKEGIMGCPVGALKRLQEARQ